ncbi:hypothetical protein CPB84DRAFT_1819515 [Gymnopilus junonius]|uniref:Uncharacterized protein n=1 Tax=Gymnopilus junonius TaxID=109634 RepID=A0A9P5N859_GYMJU|nr:hypothetical protein CPB84DRAFT_1819515 [Gymnopilus junonius]
MQTRQLVDPLPRSVWKLIIQDLYVDFEKVYASTDWEYCHCDDLKEFAGRFSLKPVKSEGEWIRVFKAWRAGVKCLYPHREMELEAPFHLDDCNHLHLPLLSQMFCSSHKHDSVDQGESTSKCSMVLCQNWNAGICLDPCCKHGVCCECGKQHQARDHEVCYTHL